MATSEVTIWELIMRPHFILGLSIPANERARMKALLAKSKDGTLSREEALVLDEYERAGITLSVLKAKARRILKPKNR